MTELLNIVDTAKRVCPLSGSERLLLVTPGPHGAEYLGALVAEFAGHTCTVLESNVRRLSKLPASSKKSGRILGRATRLPFKRHSFDAVLSFESLYAIRPPWTVLAEFHRVLVPEGKLLLVEPACHGFFSMLRDRLTGPGKRIFPLDEVKFRLARGDYAVDRTEENLRIDGTRWPLYCVHAIKKENPAEPVPQFTTAREMMERRKKKIPAGEELP